MMRNRSKAKRIKPQVGDIFEIRLPDDRFAYWKVFRDASIGIYEKIFSSPTEPPINSSFAFIVGLYSDILRSGIWPIVSREPFRSVEEEWPPPACIKDPISGTYSIYHKERFGFLRKRNVLAWKRLQCGMWTTLSIESWAEQNIP